MQRYHTMEALFRDTSLIADASMHADWRIRYAAALAMAQHPDAQWLPLLARMLEIEARRPLYTQPPARFSRGTGDTRMAEQIGPIDVFFDADYDKDTLDAWRCRGRVRQAVLFAIAAIGSADDALLDVLHGYIFDPHEDFTVKAASARALGMIGDPRSIPALREAQVFDEWCTNREATKALQRMQI